MSVSPDIFLPVAINVIYLSLSLLMPDLTPGGMLFHNAIDDVLLICLLCVSHPCL